MKKSLVVLTILVLVASFAFAAVTGYVEAKYTFDFTGEEKTLDYEIKGKHSKVSFTVSTEQAKVDGSVKPYATVTVDVKLAATFVEKEQVLEYADKYAWEIDVLEDDFTFGVALSDFRIVGENWEINFLKAVAVGDYAKSAWEVDDTAKKNAIDAPWAFIETEGITVTYDDYKVGITADRVAPLYALNVKIGSESKEMVFAEGIKGQVALGIGLSKFADEDLSFDFGVSAKAAYAKDDLTVDGAADLQYVGKQFDADVAVKVAVKPVTVDVYYATRLQEERLDTLILGEVENVVSLRAIADIDPVKVTVYAEDLVNSDRFLGVKEEGKFGALSENAQFGIYPTIDKVPLFGAIIKSLWFANAGVGYDVQENLKVTLNAGYHVMNGDLAILGEGKYHSSDLVFKVGAEYKLEKATITADAYVGKSFLSDESGNNDSDILFSCEVGAKSDKLVENATLSATLHLDKNGVIGLYKGTLVDHYETNKEPDFVAGKNYFQVACKVTF